MATFFVSLWESIFTPGPTPTLLAATNATFAALQLVLALMLFATHSIHFVVLSGLCAGLWVSINWFARELKAHQLQQEQQEEEKKRRRPKGPPRVSSSESETEVEGARSIGSLRRKGAAAPAAPIAAVSTEVEVTEEQGELKQRVAAAEAAADVAAAEETISSSSQGHKSSVSTEDEWEKVSENEKDK
ncbi:SMK killer toxin resistance protein [Collariella sp. IMI 366227]|nr:SMK killer toxin resistance protein [Collariella sp. IMI 366227]